MIVAIKNNKIIGVEKELLKSLNATLENLSEKINTINLMISSITNNPITIEDKEFEVKEIEFLTLEDIKLYSLSPKLETESLKIKTLENESLPSLEDIQIQPQTQPQMEIQPIKEEIKELNIESELNIEPLEEKPIETLETNLEQIETKPQEMEIKPIESFEMNVKLIEEETQLKEMEIKPIESLEENIQPEISAKATQESFEETQLNKIEPEITPVEEFKKEDIKKEEVIVLTFEDEFKEIDELLNLQPNEVQKLLQDELKKASEELGVDIQTINELFETLLEQIKESKNEFYKAIKEKNYEKLHKIAHSLKGASLNLRLSNLALILKYIDEKSKEKIPIEKLELLVNNFYNFVEKITQKEEASINTPNINIDETTKQLILTTIENYLKTQNEKQFKKDLKYIQKLLNIQVSDINELQEIVKGIK